MNISMRLPSLSLLILFAAAPALAQVPSSADVSKVPERFEEPKQATPPAETPAEPVRRAPRMSKEMAARTFVLKSVAIDGATVYTQESFQLLFADSLGKKISMGQAQDLADKITAKYRGDGYILSQAMLQKNAVSDGQLRIRVVEGFVDNVIIQGEVKQNSSTHLVQNYGDKIRREKPLNIKTLERYLLLMDDLPGATAKGVLRPSPQTFGAADLVVTITHKTLEGSGSVDNRGNRFIGPVQMTGIVAGNSLVGMYERTLLRYITSSDFDELQFFNVQHEQQLGREGTRLVLDASHTETEPGFTLTPLNIEGESDALSARVVHPFLRSRAKNLNGRIQFDYRNSDTDSLGLDLTNDRLSVLRVGGAFDWADRWKGVNLIDVQASQGLDVFNPSDTGPNRSRANGDAEFTKLNIDVTRTQILPAGFSLFGAVSGQITGDELLAAELFSVGGQAFGGAYDAAEISGDEGVAAKAELRYGRMTNLKFLNSYQAYGYYDIGAVWNNDGTTPDNHSLASAGLGVRANFVPWLSGSAEVGWPLTKQVNTEGDRDPRFFFNVTGRF